MYQEEQIKIIKKQMEQLFDNPVTVLAKQTGKSRPTIGHFYNRDKDIRPSLTELLYEACLELIEEKQKRQLQKIAKQKKLMRQFERIKTEGNFNVSK